MKKYFFRAAASEIYLSRTTILNATTKLVFRKCSHSHCLGALSKQKSRNEHIQAEN